MATLMLTSLGSALGGPLGAAIGGLVGQSVDRSLFGAAMSRGPRLGDLSVQTSSYGSMVPRIYGRMRVAGTVIWATDLKEGGELQSGGKGQPDTLSYSYSVSLAVALSCRPLSSIGRIWADGQLLRGAAGDFKVKTKFRFYSGSEDQAIDPLVASVEGIEAAPAFRGLALAVFEDLQLGSFGNRIPVLTFEVEGDAEPPSVEVVLNDVSAGCIVAAEERTVGGYAAYGQSADEACAPLIEGFDIDLHAEGDRLVRSRALQATGVQDVELGCSLDGDRSVRLERSQQSAAVLDSAVSLTFYDAARDYQAGEQSASTGDSSLRQRKAELPAVLEAAEAKSLAEAKLARAWMERETLKLRLPPTWLALKPGDVVHLDNEQEHWRVKKVSIEGLVVNAELIRQGRPTGVSTADSGRSVSAIDRVAEPTVAEILELPGLNGAATLSVYLAATGGQTPWKTVPVRLSGPAVDLLSSTAGRRAVMGTASKVPGASGSALLDLQNFLEVEVAHDDDWLESCEDEALVAGANLALVGSELLQFGAAAALGRRRFRLTRLLRGRGGSEWATGLHEAGERFILLDRAALTKVDLPMAAMNTGVAVTSFGLADPEEPVAERLVGGEGLKPPSPVHLRLERLGDGGALATWVRRSRVGWAWNDEVEVPLAESVERYRVRLSSASASLERTVSEPACSTLR